MPARRASTRRFATQIMAAVDSAKAAGGAEQPGPMSYLLQAIGATRLPLAI